jgi:hypothetical protein
MDETSIVIAVSTAAIASFTTLLIYLLRLRENRTKDRQEKAALFLAEIDVILYEGSKLVALRERLKNPPRKLGTSNYTAFMMTLNKKQRQRVEEAYQNCQKDYRRESFDKLRGLIVEIVGKKTD